MKIILLLAAAVLLCTPCKANDARVMRQMVERLVPQHADKFRFEQTKTPNDTWSVEGKRGRIHIKGNNANSMAVGLNHYLTHECLTSVSWYAKEAVQMPDELPMPAAKQTGSARVENRFFLNYCTFGYTMPWWGWGDWERLIDWMALHGVNMPLAITGQEAVWYRVWTKLGLSDEEIRGYFTGPAHLPWHRMSNLDRWGGALPKSWLENQEALQKRIVARERELNMRPILPAFAGHVPAALNRIYPEAKISPMSEWGGFDPSYRSHFLDPLDPLFATIQKEFLTEQTALFGTDHIYGADPFNEVSPPNWEPSFLATCAKSIFGTMTQVDPAATWLQMTWMFYYDRHQWTNQRVEAFVNAVPQGRMILLDYYCEKTEVWRQTEKYFGQPYLWCYLGNFGGNTMLAGNTREVGARIEKTFEEGGTNFSGLGSTLEGFDVNPFMYEYLFDKAWVSSVYDHDWIAQLADRRLGHRDGSQRRAWELLYDSIYTAPSGLGGGTLMNARPLLKGPGRWTDHSTSYDNKTLFEAWEIMLSAQGHTRAAYEYDVVNIGRQVLGNYFGVVRDRFAAAYARNDVAELKRCGAEMMELFADVERLLATQRSFLVGEWIADARAINGADADYYEQNARNIITTWGGRGISLNDYANRTWSGLVADFYAPRWQMFIDDVTAAAVAGREFDAREFHSKVTEQEWQWVLARKPYSAEPTGNSVDIARELMQKYKKKCSGGSVKD